MTKAVDPSTAGGLVLGAIVCALQEKTPAYYSHVLQEKLSKRNSHRGQMLVDTLVNRLMPGDMTQTEHVIIFGVIQRLHADGRPVTILAIQDALMPKDPAGFCLNVLDQILRHMDGWPTDQASIENLVKILLQERAGRDRKAKT